MTKLQYRIMQLENDLAESQYDIIELCKLYKVLLDVVEQVIKNQSGNVHVVGPVQMLFKRNQN